MEARIDWDEGMHFEAALGSGATISLDTAVEHGGKGQGARPMELLLTGLGGCMAFDVISILKKARQEVTGYQVLLSGDRAESDPKVFTRIHMEHVIRGKEISEDAVHRAVRLSEEKYCSAHAMLRAVARITTSVRILNED